MRTVRYIRILFMLLILFIGAVSETWAAAVNIGTKEGVTVYVDITGNGTVSLSSVTDITGGKRVTLSFSPSAGYIITKSSITAEPLNVLESPAPARLTQRAAPGLIDNLTVEGSGYSYYFDLPSIYNGAYVTVKFSEATEITSLSQITSSTGYYIITADITGGSPAVSTFSGSLEAAINPNTHMPYKIENLNAPLFTTLTGTVKNLVLEDVSISGHDGNTGAIACEASGDARIYNVGILSGSVGGDGYTGGLVGLLNYTGTGGARVINCYSFANITEGSYRAGIVGYNNYASKYNDLKTMVMNCMFYGDITVGGTISPIYGGSNISNDYYSSVSGNAGPTNRLNNYNYFLYEAPFSKNNIGNTIFSTYNSALAAEERFLVRFEFYRHILNSTRELAAWYATGDPASGKGIGSANKMAKWVLDKSIAPYPILKVQGTYPSVVNYDPEYTNNETGEKISRSSITKRNRGGLITQNNSSTLTITINGVGTNAPDNASIKTNIPDVILKPNRIDKDTLNYNYNYDKIQLPYYNDVGTGNYTTQTVGGNKISRVVTGWKITGMTNGTEGGYSESNYDYPNYNYADRDHYGKDIYTSGSGNSGRVYAQGAYFNVPKGVTGITIEPYWGRAAYLSDYCYDRYGYNTTDDLTQVGGGAHYTAEEGKYYITIDGNKQQVYTTVSDALGSLTGVETPMVYDYAVVLVGNYHHHATEGRDGPELSDGDKPFTIMSIDLNKDNEPDYCLIYRSGKNKPISPIRFDFITVPGIAMAHKMATNVDLGIPGNCTPMGWFEITTTGLIKYGQFEHSYNSKTLAPVIFMGGVIDQFVANNTGTSTSYNEKTKYMLFGDNVWFKMLSNGNHMDKKQAMPHRPISITGGEFESLYLSGYFRPDADAWTTGTNGDKNAECYIDGGKFGEVAGAGQENIDGNITWKINNADIRSFYGGGLKVVANGSQITGSIETTIKNSYVDLFCGGPKFGDMAPGKTVYTKATDCHFGTYFGAGYGGTSIYRECPSDYNKFNLKNYNFNSWVSNSYDSSTGNRYRGKYLYEDNIDKGVACGYEYELFAGAQNNVGRLHLKYASFSLAQTNDVKSDLIGCTVEGNFYGGGSLGKVAGKATSTLENCTVNGSVFGAGYSASAPKASIMALGGFKVNNVKTNPNYNETTAVYEKADYPPTTDYTWVHSTTEITSGTQTLGDDYTIKTNGNLDGLGRVIGKVTLEITGNTFVKGDKVRMDDDGFVVKDEFTGEPVIVADPNHIGGVFGGGDASGAESDTEVIINTTGLKTNCTYNVQNVFGGGNDANVEGDAKIFLAGKTIVNGNVFGGGNKGLVEGSTEVNIQQNAPTE